MKKAMPLICSLASLVTTAFLASLLLPETEPRWSSATLAIVGGVAISVKELFQLIADEALRWNMRNAVRRLTAQVLALPNADAVPVAHLIEVLDSEQTRDAIGSRFDALAARTSLSRQLSRAHDKLLRRELSGAQVELLKTLSSF